MKSSVSKFQQTAPLTHCFVYAVAYAQVVTACLDLH